MSKAIMNEYIEKKIKKEIYEMLSSRLGIDDKLLLLELTIDMYNIFIKYNDGK